MFVGQETPYGVIVAAGINPNFGGSKRDKVYFAFRDDDHGYILRQAFNVMWHMLQANDPRFPIWDKWLTAQFGPLSFVEEPVNDTSAAADDEPSEANAITIAAAAKWVQHVLL